MIRLLAILLAATTAAAQDAVRLRHLAVVDTGAPITLAMIADLSGPGAQALGDLVIIESPENELAGGTLAAHIDVQRVRSALKASDRCDFSALLLSGSVCEVRPEGLAASRRDSTSDTPRVLPRLAGTIPLTTVKGHVAAAIARSLDARPDDVRLTFDPRDARLLATTAVGRTVDASPTGRSDDMPVRITVYERDRIVLSETVRVSVSVRRSVCVLDATKRRGEAITEADFTIERRWLRPMEEPVSSADAIGRAMATTIKAGKPLMREHAEQPIVVKKGDLVTVHSVSGGIVVQMTARALADARDGEIIEFEHMRGRGVFLARMNGSGHAVAVSRSMNTQELSP